MPAVIREIPGYTLAPASTRKLKNDKKGKPGSAAIPRRHLHLATATPPVSAPLRGVAWLLARPGAAVLRLPVRRNLQVGRPPASRPADCRDARGPAAGIHSRPLAHRHHTAAQAPVPGPGAACTDLLRVLRAARLRQRRRLVQGARQSKPAGT